MPEEPKPKFHGQSQGRNDVPPGPPSFEEGVGPGGAEARSSLAEQRRAVLAKSWKRRKEISHGIIDEVERKVAGLRKLTKASIRTALVYDGELAKSVPAEGYFDFIVSAGSVFATPFS